MVILSKLADYGVILATRLAAREAGQASAAQLAAETRLSATTVAKILKLLARAGVVVAARGAAGGYHLARAAEQTTLAEVVAAIDGQMALTQCTSQDPRQTEPCDRHSFCSTKPHWPIINQAVEHALSGVTLADMRATPFSAPGLSASRDTRMEAAV